MNTERCVEAEQQHRVPRWLAAAARLYLILSLLQGDAAGPALLCQAALAMVLLAPVVHAGQPVV